MAVRTMEAEKPLVLLVDDDEAIHELLESDLCASGFEVVHALDGHDAVVAATQLLPDVIVMDFNLPALNGCEAAELLKTTKRTWNIPIVMWTSEAEEHCRELARRAGCDGFVTKPCPPAALRRAITEVLLGIERAAPESAGRLLVVEDDGMVRKAVREALEDEGYEVADAANGLEALARLHVKDARPDLILLDLMMPVMDGWQFRMAQRKDRELAVIPVVALTAVPPARRGQLDVRFCLDKPVRLDQLLATVEKALSQSKLERPARGRGIAV